MPSGNKTIYLSPRKILAQRQMDINGSLKMQPRNKKENQNRREMNF